LNKSLSEQKDEFKQWLLENPFVLRELYDHKERRDRYASLRNISRQVVDAAISEAMGVVAKMFSDAEKAAMYNEPLADKVGRAKGASNVEVGSFTTRNPHKTTPSTRIIDVEFSEPSHD